MKFYLYFLIGIYSRSPSPELCDGDGDQGIVNKRAERDEMPECLKNYKSPKPASIERAKQLLEQYGVFDGHNGKLLFD